MKSTVRKGTITETKVILCLLELGYNIFIPYGDGSKVDIVIQDTEGSLFKVQVKTTRVEGIVEIFNAYSTSRTRSTIDSGKKVKYTKKDIDYFSTIDNKGNVYLIPVEEVTIQRCILGRNKRFIINKIST